ncbi:YtxH domain-containing protein [Pontibacter sp. SGAir0037]|uniref:YtxH domain-containing protein n=1 Tax=Pontibacter sp. SGAir0037 TaxID=2571030 RepID=UPI0010CD05A8|nr:YtxH domain-containing protein [Pontibacter sp. SGAir0037]QCR24608.1 hypothetical protein C1N53_21105 [Pontibacter sp. SGAir0037]
MKTKKASTTSAESTTSAATYDRLGFRIHTPQKEEAKESAGISEAPGMIKRTIERTMKGKTTAKSSNTGTLVASVLAGAGVGALAAVLLAPEKGKVLRTQIANSAGEAGDLVTQQMTKVMDTCKSTMNTWTGKVKTMANGATSGNGKSETGTDDPAKSNPRYF